MGVAKKQLGLCSSRTMPRGEAFHVDDWVVTMGMQGEIWLARIQGFTDDGCCDLLYFEGDDGLYTLSTDHGLWIEEPDSLSAVPSDWMVPISDGMFACHNNFHSLLSNIILQGGGGGSGKVRMAAVSQQCCAVFVL